MRNGDVVRAADYEFKFNNVTDIVGPNYVAARAEIVVSQNGVEKERMYPEKRNYTASGNEMTETAIDSGLFRDLYVSLGEPVGSGAWSVRVYYKPFVGWIWAGALLMALGGGLAVSDRRYALAAKKEREARGSVNAKEVPATVAAQTESV